MYPHLQREATSQSDANDNCFVAQGRIGRPLKHLKGSDQTADEQVILWQLADGKKLKKKK